MRKLVTIQRVLATYPIKDADMIECCQILGWQCITKKNEVKVHDLVVYFEIDSFIPMKPYFEFLKKSTTFQGQEGYRLRTIKLKKGLSQGLVLPISHFPSEIQEKLKTKVEGEDVTDILEVIKYDNFVQEQDQRPGLKSGRPSGSFPSFIPKTDQERIQNLTHLWKTLDPETTFEESLKLDGSSMTCYKVSVPPTLWQRIKAIFTFKTETVHFGVCSRNLELSRKDSAVIVFDNQGTSSEYSQSNFWATAIKYNLQDKLPIGYAIQGELIGPKIQANHEKVNTLEYYVFDVFDITTGLYLPPQERVAFCAVHNIPHVPITDTKAQPFKKTLQELLTHVDTESMNPNTISEGRVYKSNTSQLTFKVINNRYLIKNEL